MQTNHANTIKGLSIAVIIIAALGVLGSIIGMVMMGAMAPYMEYASTTLEYSDGYYSYSDDAMAAQILMAVGSGMFGWVLICCALTLIAGIIALRNRNNPQKLGMVFGWAIVGAVFSFIGAGLITGVLMIIIAVFAYKDKQMVAAGTYNQVAMPYAAPAQPQATVATPVQPAAVPVQPTTAPTQPSAAPFEPTASQPMQPGAQQIQSDQQPIPGAVQVSETVIEQQNPYNPNSL